jgi:hypothetical protein
MRAACHVDTATCRQIPEMMIVHNPNGGVSYSSTFKNLFSSAYYTLAILSIMVALIGFALKQEWRVDLLTNEVKEINTKLDNLDNHGSRSVALLNDRQNGITDRINSVVERFNGVQPILTKIEVIEARQFDILRRLDEFEKRKVEALEARQVEMTRRLDELEKRKVETLETKQSEILRRLDALERRK